LKIRGALRLAFYLCNRFTKTTKLKYLKVDFACLRGPNVLFLAQTLDYGDGSTHITNWGRK